MNGQHAVTGLLKKLQADVAGFFSTPRPASGMSLFEIACWGNAEKTLQGELLCHLRSKDWFAVQEAGFLCASDIPRKFTERDIDILVFTRSPGASTMPTPLCCIELKHFSSNQGSAKALCKGLDADMMRRHPHTGHAFVPLMQVAMYTTIATFDEKADKVGLHRFARSYCGPVKRRDFLNQFDSWRNGKAWIIDPVIHQDTDPYAACRLLSGETMTGKVDAFVGVRAPQ